MCKIRYLAAVTLWVAEGERAPEGALDELPLLPEHGVERRVAGDRVAQPVHWFNVLLAVAWN